MTNMIAFLLGAVLCIAIAVDVTLYDASNLVFLGRRLLELIEWTAFWR